MEEYKISLGAEISQQGLSNVKDQIKTFESNPIKLTLDKNLSNEIKAIKEQIDSLGSSNGKNKNALAINTESVEKSLNDVHSTINEIKTALGTIDSKSGMKSLLSSINQISTALEKASGQFGELNAELKKLSSKDFGINIDLKFGSGKNPVAANAAYGQKVRNETLPQLKSQLGELTKYLQQYYGVADEYAAISKLFSSTTNNFGKSNVVNTDLISFLNDFGSINTGSLASQMTQYKTIIEQIISMVKYTDNADMNVGINNITAGFSKSADELIGDAKRIQSGLDQAEKQAEETKQQFKGLFGSGIDSDTLNAQLDSIVNNLTEIKSALQSLSANNSIDGLTQSFNGLSQTLESITKNITTFKQAFDSGLNNIGSNIAQEIKNDLKSVDSVGEQVGSKLGDSIEDGLKKSLNLDDSINKEVRNLMKSEGISWKGVAGKQAEEEISSAFRGYLTDGSDANIRKVTDALLNNKRVVDETKKEYQALDDCVRSINKGNTKVLLDKDIVSEFGDNFKDMQKLFGKGFVTKVGKNDTFTTFDKWFSGLPDSVTNTLRDNYNRINAFDALHNQLKQQRGKIYMSTKELLSSGEFDISNAENAIRAAASNVESYEQKAKQASNATAEAVSSGEQKKQQAYQETLETIKRIDAETQKHKDNLRKIDEQFEPLYDEDSGFSKEDVDQLKQPVIDDYWSGQEDELAKYNSLLQERIELENKLKTIESSFKTATGASSTSNIDDAIKDVGIEAKATETHIENLISTLRSLGFSSGNIDNITKDFDNLGITVKNVTSKLQSDGSVTVTVKGIDQYERAVTLMRGFKKNLETDEFDYVNFGSSVSQDFKETENAFKKLKSLAKEIGSVKSDIAQLNTTDSANEIKKLTSHLEECESEYNDLLAITGRNLSDNQWEELDRTVDDVNKTLDILDSKLADTSALKKRNQAFKELSSVAKEIDSLEFNIAKLKSTGGNENQIALLENQLDGLRTTYKTLVETMDTPLSSDQWGSIYSGVVKTQEKIAQLNAKVADASALEKLKSEAKELEAELNKLKDIASQMGKLEVDILKLDKNSNANEIQTLENQLYSLRNTYNELRGSINFGKLSEGQVNDLTSVFAKTEASLDRLKAKLADTSAVKEQAQAYNYLLSTAKEIGKLEVKIAGLDDKKNANEIVELSKKLNSLKADYESLKDAFNGKLSVEQIGNLQAVFDEAKISVSQLEAKINDAKNNFANKIKLDIEVGGDIKKKVDDINIEFKSLSNATDQLVLDVDELNGAFNAMKIASAKNDVDSLETAYTQLEQVLKRVNNQLDDAKNVQATKIAEDKLRQNAGILSSEMGIWLRDNSKAADQFGDRIRALQVELKSCDGVRLDGIKGEFKEIKLEANSLGLNVQKLGDRLKTQFQKYSAYFGVAELFMYGEQALRDMFEQVRAIDTAMTELKKVTDETDATYNNFLSNAGERAKEIGTTIDGLIESTSQFARLGYGFKDAQGLAEVANIYAVVGDEVEGVEGATTSLISTMTAFKDEMKGLSNTDFSMGIIDVFNELGNKFAISSGGLGEAFQRAASSMSVAGNTLSETASLIVAANTVVQNPEKVGNAFKTISMRLRAAKTQLSEMGEDTEGMAESTASLRAEMLALTGIDLMESPTQFKSTFKFLEELAGKWENLTDIQRASVIELAAGKHQGLAA